MNENTRRVLLAIALSIFVLLGWQYFVAGPQIDAAREASQAQQEAAQNAEGAGSGVGISIGSNPVGVPGAVLTREAALALTTRVPIDTPSLVGSINLSGGQIDDLRLRQYLACEPHAADCETPEEVVLLSPAADRTLGYFAEFGWASASAIVVDKDTPWMAAAGAVLTPETPVVLSWTSDAGLVFRRTIAVDADYMFTVSDVVENTGAGSVVIYPYGRVVRYGDNLPAGSFVLYEGMIGVLGSEGFLQPGYAWLKDEAGCPQPLVGTCKTYARNTQGWLGFTDKYWATALIPTAGQEFTAKFARLTDSGLVRYQADYVGSGISLDPSATAASTAHLFAGAKEVAIVDGYDQALDVDRFELLIDWGWFYFITKPMFQLLDWLYQLVGNFGVAILITTVLVKLLFFPLANRSYRSMAAMRKVGPQIKALRERYRDDRAKQQQAMIEIYKKEKINPVAGCWPVLVQIPVFFSLYKVIYTTIEMRHAPFFGWIYDLSAPDPTSIFNLFGLIPFTPPSFLMVGAWAVLMGVTMWIQMRLNPQQPDRTSQLVFNLLPILFTFMLASFPVGLVIYWAWNNFLSILQQSFIMRRNGVKVDLLGNIRDSFRRKPKKAGN